MGKYKQNKMKAFAFNETILNILNSSWIMGWKKSAMVKHQNKIINSRQN